VIGTAVTRKEFPALDTPMLKFFDESKVKNIDERKRRITIKHLLTMSDGMDWNEGVSYDSPANTTSAMEASFDWVQLAVDQPMAAEPGTRYNYNSGASQILAHIFRVATGVDIEEYAHRHLFTPLGIDRYYWKRTAKGIIDTEGGLYLRPRDLAKIWYLFLKNGQWDGRIVVDAAWVKASVTPAMSPNANAKYGYKWWLYPYGEGGSQLAWAGSGFGGQRPLAFPDHDLIVVYTAWNVNRPGMPTRVAIDRVLQAIRGS
jgi:CubicO group peptidase (beta-lactamase class C family)